MGIFYDKIHMIIESLERNFLRISTEFDSFVKPAQPARRRARRKGKREGSDALHRLAEALPLGEVELDALGVRDLPSANDGRTDSCISYHSRRMIGEVSW